MSLLHFVLVTDPLVLLNRQFTNITQKAYLIKSHTFYNIYKNLSMG